MHEAMLREAPSGVAHRPTLLLVEDNRADAVLVQHLLRDRFDGQSYDVSHVATLSAALNEVHNHEFACTLLDLGLPDGGGVETVSALRAAAPEMPIVVLTGHDDELLGIEALKGGAQDYLVKGQIGGRSLARAIRFAIERLRLARVAALRVATNKPPLSLPFDMSF